MWPELVNTSNSTGFFIAALPFSLERACQWLRSVTSLQATWQTGD
jgi:hypothetical protein